MKINRACYIILILSSLLLASPNNKITSSNLDDNDKIIPLFVNPDSILNELSPIAFGINADYLMDDDKFLKPATSTAEALKRMGVKCLRYPGGEKSDCYMFSVTPYEKSIPTLARTGKGCVNGRDKALNEDRTDFNRDVLDFDEFIQLCKEIDTEPIIVVAADGYLADFPESCTFSTRDELISHAAKWVRYANVKNNYGIKYWMIGNESWHPNNVNSSAEIYAKDVIDFSIAMKEVDSTIFIIPNGNTVESWKPVLEEAIDHIDMLCVSNYPIYNYNNGYFTYLDTLQNLDMTADMVTEAIELYAAHKKDKLKILVAEYGPFDWGDKWGWVNDMGKTICNFDMTGQLLNYPNVISTMYWNTRWLDNLDSDEEPSVFDALDRDGNHNAIGKGLALWGNYLGDKMLLTTSTQTLQTFASLLPEGNSINYFLVNKDTINQKISLTIENKKIEKMIKLAELRGEGPDDIFPILDMKEEKMSLENPIDINGTTIIVFKLIL